MSDIRPTLDILRGGAPTVIIEFSLGGQILRYSSAGNVTITSRVSGSTARNFSPGLTVDTISETVAVFAGDISPRTASVTLTITPDVALLLRGGHSIYTATAEISRIWPEQQWEDRRVLLQGYVDEPLWGAAGEPLSFAVNETTASDPALLPPATWTLTSATFPRASADRDPETTYVGTPGRDPNREGDTFPLVIGFPGSGVPVDTPASEWGTQIPGSPAVYVELTDSSVTNTDHIIMVSGGTVEATAAKLWNMTDLTKTVPTTTVKHSRDKLGQSFAYLLTTSSDRPDQGDELWVSWLPASGGGMSDPYGTGTLQRADHVIRWALSQSGLRTDDSMIPRLSILSAIKIDGYINASVSPWEWLQASILPLLPCSPVLGPDGLYVAVWDLNATTDQAVEHLQVGRNCERVTPISMTSTDDVINRFTISFAPNASTDGSSQYRTLTGIQTAEEVADPFTLPNGWCIKSQSLAAWGVRSDTIETAYIYDQASAEIILGWQARMHSFPRRRLGLQVGYPLGYLRPGDTISLTETDLSITAQVAFIDSITPIPGGFELGVWWLEPARLQ